MIRVSAIAAILLGLIGVPVVLPWFTLAARPDAWSAFHDVSRWSGLAFATIQLTALTLCMAMPAGIAVAVLLERSNLPGGRWLRALTIATVAIPLPIYAASWRALFGNANGVWAAAIIHALAGWPWFALIVGHGLRSVERSMEDDASLHLSPPQVLWRVTLPRSLPFVLAAAGWVALQTVTEMTVTDIVQVRSFAEEVYTQNVAPTREGEADDARTVLARAVAASLPQVVVSVVLAMLLLPKLRRVSPESVDPSPNQPLLQFHARSWLISFGLAAAMTALIAVPWWSMMRIIGASSTLSYQLIKVVEQSGGLIFNSVVAGLAVGIVAATLAWLASWLARDSVLMRWTLISVAVTAAVTPGPIVGLGLWDAINIMVGWETSLAGRGILNAVLYTGPSMLPSAWASLIRVFPVAVLILLPAVRRMPSSLLESARIEGASAFTQFRRVIVPVTAGPALRAALACSVLSLGEVSAGMFVATPGGHTFAHQVFIRLHYGVTPDLAALCLLMGFAVVVFSILLASLIDRA